ncbi:MAG: nucleotidyl transferase AbiEii/AbiGii toxin family protein [Deltaproteobacteria bacterium]|nr:nucleotidyl transferase AbiEii/AbiGii toxin family protein [Deltaproteobacteria bacterium]
MNLTPEVIAREATATGFGAGPLEKVFRLMSLLDGLNTHPFLKTRLALKGGTALNLFHFDIPRLSVDIDLNYIGAVEREAMLEERPKVEQAIQDVCSREGLNVRRMPPDHAGGKWQLRYTGARGESGNLALDVNFLLRAPLWPTRVATCRPLGAFRAAPVQVLDLHELTAGKLVALLARSASRDIFDSHALLASAEIYPEKLRIGFVAYGGMSRKDWRMVSPEDVRADAGDVERELVPMLRTDLAPSRRTLASWAETLVAETRERLSLVLPLRENEREFLRRLNDLGEIEPSLLTDDPSLREILSTHPGLGWKALNVRQLVEKQGHRT